MSAIKKLSLGMALLALTAAGVAQGAEVSADPVCWGCRQRSCYDPCCPRVGPVRRFFRRVFHPCCPPPARVCAPPPVVMPCPPPCPAPCPPQGFAPGAAPVMLDRPTPAPGLLPPPPPGPVDAPATNSSLRPAVLTPPTRPTPIRLDRIASREGYTTPVVRAKAEPKNLVTLVQVGNPNARREVEADGAGRISVDLTPGTWVVYVRDAAGKSIERVRLVIRERRVIRVQVLES